MDELVRQAIARWPNVPAVHGWLRLDRRGQWYLIDRGSDGFDEIRDGAGSRITSPQIVEFIGRNYEHDDEGRWYWQNGPQRVFVDLDRAPLVLRVLGDAGARQLVTHTGLDAGRVLEAAVDADGDLYLLTDAGPGLVDDRDIASLDLDEDTLIDRGRRHRIETIAVAAHERFGFVPRPRP